MLLVVFFSIVGVFKGLGVSKSQSNTAKTIVKINQDVGLFYKYFPAEWKKWGEKREYWYIYGFAGLGIVTSLVIVLYHPDTPALPSSMSQEPNTSLKRDAPMQGRFKHSYGRVT